MPTYEYHCPDCDHRFELFQSMTAEPAKDCPSCESSNVKRLISAGAGLIFKGSGFYLTDYARKGSGSEAPPCQAESGSSSATPPAT